MEPMDPPLDPPLDRQTEKSTDRQNDYSIYPLLRTRARGNEYQYIKIFRVRACVCLSVTDVGVFFSKTVHTQATESCTLREACHCGRLPSH